MVFMLVYFSVGNNCKNGLRKTKVLCTNYVANVFAVYIEEISIFKLIFYVHQSM